MYTWIQSLVRAMEDTRQTRPTGVLSTGAGHLSECRGMESLEAMISKAGVQSYFSGHLPLMDCLSHNGVDYYLAGTGGCATSQGRPMTCSVNGRTVSVSR